MFYAIIIFSALFAYLCWRNLYWALYLTVACLPAYGVRFEILGLPLTLLEVMILILFLFWFKKSFFHAGVWPRSQFMGSALLVLLAATVALLWAPDMIRAAGIWKAYFLEGFLFFVVFSGLVKTKEEIRNVILALGVPALAISIFAIIQKISGGWLVPYEYWYLGDGQRVTSFYSYPNAVGLFIAPIVMLFVGYLVFLIKQQNPPSLRFGAAGKKTTKQILVELVFSTSVVITGILAIVFAKSDGAMVGLAAGVAVFGLLYKKTRWWAAGGLLLVICYLILAYFKVLPGLPESIWQTLTFADWSGKVRLSIWHETWQMIRDHWLWGVGLTGYQSVFLNYHQATALEIFLYPHNFVLNFWVELGAGGLLVFLYLIGKYFWLGIKNCSPLTAHRSPLAISLVAVMVVILVHGLVDVPFFKNDLAILWWIFIGLMSSVSYLES